MRYFYPTLDKIVM